MTDPFHTERWYSIEHDYTVDPVRITWSGSVEKADVTPATVGTLVSDPHEEFNNAYEGVQYGWFDVVIRHRETVPLAQKLLHAATKTTPDRRLDAVDALAEQAQATKETWDAAHRFISSMRVDGTAEEDPYAVAAAVLSLMATALDDQQFDKDACYAHPDVDEAREGTHLRPGQYVQTDPIVQTIRDVTPTTKRIHRQSKASSQ